MNASPHPADLLAVVRLYLSSKGAWIKWARIRLGSGVGRWRIDLQRVSLKISTNSLLHIYMKPAMDAPGDLYIKVHAGDHMLVVAPVILRVLMHLFEMDFDASHLDCSLRDDWVLCRLYSEQ